MKARSLGAIEGARRRYASLVPGLLALQAVPGFAAQASAPLAAAQAPAQAWDVPRRPVPESEWPELLKVSEVLIPIDRAWRLMDRKMQPRHVTIHGTGNRHPKADAQAHAHLLLRGQRSADPLSRSGYLSWHFTVDPQHSIQHLPCTEQGDHADFDGPGNRHSIGVEIAMADGQDKALALHRSAMLTAHLLRQFKMPLSHVVPHFHWPRAPDNDRKNCPEMLLDAGRPGERWRAYVSLVGAYHKGLARFRGLQTLS